LLRFGLEDRYFFEKNFKMIFKWLLIRDFAQCAPGMDKKALRGIIASLEKSYTGGHWDLPALSDLIRYGLMFGLDMQILDDQGKEIISSQYVAESLSGFMRKKISQRVDLIFLNGNYERRPLFTGNKEIGTLKFRFFRKKKEAEEGEARGKVDAFFRISFWIASLGALMLSLLFSGYVPD
jgi:hypothetical protein